MKKLWIALAALPVIAAAIWLGAWIYLHSNHVLREVTEQVAADYGGPVTIDSVDIGLFSATIHGLHLFEPGQNPQAGHPWITAKAVTLNVPLWDLARGIIDPTHVDIRGGKVVVRFDDAGHLLTRLPAQLMADPAGAAPPIPWSRVPTITIEQSELVLRKDGHGDLTADAVTAELTPQAGRIVLDGSADSPFGKIGVHGLVNEQAELASARIWTVGTAHVTNSLLERLPLLPASIVQEVHVEHADAQASLAVAYSLPEKEMHYHIDVSAKNGVLDLPSVGVTVRDASAQLAIDDGVIHVRGAVGKTLGGTVHAAGELEKHGPIMRLSLSSLKADNLDIDDVPIHWGIPPLVRKSMAGGKLFGTAKAAVAVGEPRAIAAMAAALLAQMGGDAGAAWPGDAAFLAAVPVAELSIESEGKGEVRDPAGKVKPIQFDWRLSPHARAAAPLVSSARLESLAPPAGRTGRGVTAELFTTLVALPLEFAGSEAPVQDAQPQPAKPAKYFDLQFNLKNASLADLIKKEDLPAPVPIDGKISMQVKASIPIDRLHDLKAYKAEGAVQIRPLVISGLKLDEVTADFKAADGVLEVTSLRSALADNAGKQAAALSGSARAQFAPEGPISVDLRFERLPLARLIAQSPEEVQGTLSGTLTVRGDAGKTPITATLQADGKITSSGLEVYGLAVDEFGTELKLKDGVLSFPGLHARLAGQPLAPTASARLNKDDSIAARIVLHDKDLAALDKIAAARKIDLPKLSGSLSAEAVMSAKTGGPTITGEFETRDLKIDTATLGDLRVNWALKDRQVELGAALYGGKMAGTALLPKDGKPAKLDLEVTDINLRELAGVLRLPLKVAGRVDGTLKATATPAAKDRPSKVDVLVDFKSPILRVENIPAEELRGSIEYQAGKIDYHLTGKSLGGSFELQGQDPGKAAPAKQADEKAGQGRLRIRDVRVGELLSALGVPQGRDMRGTLNIDLPFTQNTLAGFPQGTGTLRITNVRLRDAVLTQSIRADLVLGGGRLRVQGLEGDLAQGTVAGRALLDLRKPGAGEFALDLDGVQSGQLLAPWTDKKIQGPLQARIRGKLGRTWEGTADIQMASGKLAGMDFTDGRLPIRWSLAQGEKRAKADIDQASAQLANGRATGKLSLAWDNGARVNGAVRLERVQLTDLLRETVGSTSVAAGRTTAKIDIQGTNVRSLDDLTGDVTASFEQAQALQVPVLQQIAPFLSLSPSTTFQKGSMVARLDRGTATIKQLTLQGNTVQVFIDGTITTRERLNLHVVAKTRDIGWPTLRLGPIGLRVPPVGPVPLVLAEEVSTLISKQVVYLDVTGTPKSPVIRPEPLRILSSEAVRFFLNPSNSPITLNP